MKLIGLRLRGRRGTSAVPAPLRCGRVGSTEGDGFVVDGNPSGPGAGSGVETASVSVADVLVSELLTGAGDGVETAVGAAVNVTLVINGAVGKSPGLLTVSSSTVDVTNVADASPIAVPSSRVLWYQCGRGAAGAGFAQSVSHPESFQPEASQSGNSHPG